MLRSYRVVGFGCRDQPRFVAGDGLGTLREEDAIPQIDGVGRQDRMVLVVDTIRLLDGDFLIQQFRPRRFCRGDDFLEIFVHVPCSFG